VSVSVQWEIGEWALPSHAHRKRLGGKRVRISCVAFFPSFPYFRSSLLASLPSLPSLPSLSALTSLFLPPGAPTTTGS
jgi:hypothetical protein